MSVPVCLERGVRTALFLLLLLAAGCARTAIAQPVPVTEFTDDRVVPSGQSVEVRFYVPDPPGDAPLPVLILSHGFARGPARHADNARWIAARNFIVATPESPGWFQGDAQQQNIDALVDHARWIVDRGSTPGDALEGLVDSARIALAGHSAGGAVSFEAASVLVEQGGPVPAAVVLLDGVPWPRTLDAAPAWPRLPLASLRAEPSSCNAQGSVVELLELLPFAQEDVRVVGSNHCDQENPSDFLCALGCSAANSERQERFRLLLYLFLLEEFDAPPVDPVPTYDEELDALEANGRVVRSTLNAELAAEGWKLYRDAQ